MNAEDSEGDPGKDDGGEEEWKQVIWRREMNKEGDEDEEEED